MPAVPSLRPPASRNSLAAFPSTATLPARLTTSRLRAEQGRNLWCGGFESVGYCPDGPRPNLCKSRLAEFAGELDSEHVGSTSATDLPTASLTGVATKAWIWPLSGPLRTNPMPPISPRSLILAAKVAHMLELSENNVLRLVITPSCQMKAWAQLKVESQLPPTTWPLLLLPKAMFPISPGRRFLKTVISVSFCQTAPSWVLPSALPTCPTICPRLLMPQAVPPCS